LGVFVWKVNQFGTNPIFWPGTDKLFGCEGAGRKLSEPLITADFSDYAD
jgi:hypothetical protein